MKKLKKSLSFALVLVLVLSLCAPAFADSVAYGKPKYYWAMATGDSLLTKTSKITIKNTSTDDLWITVYEMKDVSSANAGTVLKNGSTFMIRGGRSTDITVKTSRGKVSQICFKVETYNPIKSDSYKVSYSKFSGTCCSSYKQHVI